MSPKLKQKMEMELAAYRHEAAGEWGPAAEIWRQMGRTSDVWARYGADENRDRCLALADAMSRSWACKKEAEDAVRSIEACLKAPPSMKPVFLEVAYRLATKAHDGQADRQGYPYILHPTRVAAAVSDAGYDAKCQVAAILHDVFEDTDTPTIELVQFGTEIVEAVDALTRREGETYKEYVARCCANPIARVVKLYDVLDNLRPGAPELRKRYAGTLAHLKEAYGLGPGAAYVDTLPPHGLSRRQLESRS